MNFSDMILRVNILTTCLPFGRCLPLLQSLNEQYFRTTTRTHSCNQRCLFEPVFESFCF